MKKYLKAKEVEKILSCSRSTINRLCESKKLNPVKLSDSKTASRLFLEEEVNSLLNKED